MISSGEADPVVSARRLGLRVASPLASTAIFHLITSFKYLVRRCGPHVPTRARPGTFGSSPSHRVSATRHDNYLCPASKRQERTVDLRFRRIVTGFGSPLGDFLIGCPVFSLPMPRLRWRLEFSRLPRSSPPGLAPGLAPGRGRGRVTELRRRHRAQRPGRHPKIQAGRPSQFTTRLQRFGLF